MITYLNAVVAGGDLAVLHLDVVRRMCELALMVGPRALASLELATHLQLQPTRVLLVEEGAHVEEGRRLARRRRQGSLRWRRLRLLRLSLVRVVLRMWRLEVVGGLRQVGRRRRGGASAAGHVHVTGHGSGHGHLSTPTEGQRRTCVSVSSSISKKRAPKVCGRRRAVRDSTSPCCSSRRLPPLLFVKN